MLYSHEQLTIIWENEKNMAGISWRLCSVFSWSCGQININIWQVIRFKKLSRWKDLVWRRGRFVFSLFLIWVMVFWVWRRQWHPTPVLLPGKSHGWRSLVGCSPWGLESDTTERLHFHFSLSCIGEGNGNPLQCSCLENPTDRGAWWAAISGVAQSWTQLKLLSSSSSILGYASLIEWNIGKAIVNKRAHGTVKCPKTLEQEWLK